MSKLEQIESAVASLAEKEFKAFRRWFAEFDAARWENKSHATAKTENWTRLYKGPKPSMAKVRADRFEAFCEFCFLESLRSTPC
jgi:hypothetical protein